MGNLSDKYCIVGVGETAYTRNSGMSTRRMAVIAIRNALTDAGLSAKDLDGMMSYNGNDSTTSTAVSHDLGARLNFFMDVHGGGSSTEALIGLAMGAIEVGMCHTVAIFRSMNGYSAARRGGTGVRAASPVVDKDLISRPYGWMSAAQLFSLTFMRHMHEYGTTSEQVAHVKVAHSKHASNNPKAIYKQRVTVEDVLNSRWVVKPLHLLDCCVETDNATALIVTSVDRARDLRQRPVHVLGIAARVCRPHVDFNWEYGPITRATGYYAKEAVFGMAGVGPEDIDVTGAYDAFTFTAMLHLEEYGFCAKGEGGKYVSSGIIELGGRRPNNTGGGHLCEGYTHGINLVAENVRQLRWQADDSCPGWREGIHTYDYGEGGCRQVREPKLSMNMAAAFDCSALILRRG